MIVYCEDEDNNDDHVHDADHVHDVIKEEDVESVGHADMAEGYDYLFKLLLLGNSGVGKTSFLNRLVDDSFDVRYVSTVGIDFREKRVLYQPLDGSRAQRIRLQLWDTAGQERYRSLTTAFFRDAMGFLLLFDLTDERSFLDVANWVDQVETHVGELSDLEVVLCGTKLDLEASLVIDRPTALRLAERYKVAYFETSAMNGHNVSVAVDRIVHAIMTRINQAVLDKYPAFKKRGGFSLAPSLEFSDSVFDDNNNTKISDSNKCKC